MAEPVITSNPDAEQVLCNDDLDNELVGKNDVLDTSDCPPPSKAAPRKVFDPFSPQ